MVVYADVGIDWSDLTEEVEQAERRGNVFVGLMCSLTGNVMACRVLQPWKLKASMVLAMA
jgi:hypothetical protein